MPHSWISSFTYSMAKTTKHWWHLRASHKKRELTPKKSWRRNSTAHSCPSRPKGCYKSAIESWGECACEDRHGKRNTRFGRDKLPEGSRQRPSLCIYHGLYGPLYWLRSCCLSNLGARMVSGGWDPGSFRARRCRHRKEHESMSLGEDLITIRIVRSNRQNCPDHHLAQYSRGSDMLG